MKKLTSKEVRQTWLDFWKSKEHEIVASKSLIPVNDPSLLWINSGVATLKDFFSGKTKPNNPRITNSQKSIRTNDIENVGVTARHHTMFEMLGNFSIGEYFKKEVLTWAYELLFDVFKFDKELIYITYYSEDKETLNKWIELGVAKDHLIKGDRETNFWDLGQGPCGPDTEIFFDRGVKYDFDNKGIELLEKDLENDRYIEIWNIVFSEFNNDGNGNYEELSQKNIDTGAGLERLVSIFQDAPTNFDTDLFLPLIAEIEKMTTFKYEIDNYFKDNAKQTQINKNFKVIADHARAFTCAIEDGAKPSNTSRGYIIRRLIRRAYRSGKELGIKEETFLEKLIIPVTKILDHFTFDVEMIKKIIIKEQVAFSKTIKQGQALLEKSIIGKKELDVETAFRLFETFGFPIELTQEILDEKGIKLDMSGYNKLVQKHANASKGKKLNAMESQIKVIQEVNELKSKFVGYDKNKTNTKVVFQKMENGFNYVLLEETPFYPTGGGQLHDAGTIDGQEVIEVGKDKHGNIWHKMSKEVGNTVEASLDNAKRKLKESNHTATHILSYALKEVFGKDIVQLGSYNDENKLRFDFPLDSKPTKEQISKVEDIVNDVIKKDIKRKYIETTIDEAVKLGAIKLEGETYGEEVRVVDLGVSKEFCGGVHVNSTKEIESFKILKTESKGSGIYRIEAITSDKLINEINKGMIEEMKETLQSVITKVKKLNDKYKIEFKDTMSSLKETILKAKEDYKKLRKSSKSIDISYENILFVEKDGIKLHLSETESAGEVKQKAIMLREKFPDALIILIAPAGNKHIIAVASNKYDALEEVRKRYPNFKGGGNNKFAMGSK
ncbi:MAG: alanine--tRNA ligase [Mycoplasmataceae bacterium]|nr:alanine--tRNA ligase [Mycoplasmataceae bacterium]